MQDHLEQARGATLALALSPAEGVCECEDCDHVVFGGDEFCDVCGKCGGGVSSMGGI